MEIVSPKFSVTACMPWTLKVRLDKQDKVMVYIGNKLVGSASGGPGVVSIKMPPIKAVFMRRYLTVVVETESGESASKTFAVLPASMTLFSIALMGMFAYMIRNIIGEQTAQNLFTMSQIAVAMWSMAVVPCMMPFSQ